MKKIIIIFILIFVLILLVACSYHAKEESIVTPQVSITPIAVKSTNTPTPVPTPTMEPTPTVVPYTDIVIGAAGDIMCHTRQVKDAKAAADGEGYSFDHWFKYIKPALEYPDLMIANLEGPIAGSKRGYNGYPMFNFPDEIVKAMQDAGIDVALNANNHLMDQRVNGAKNTIDVLEKAGMLHTGAWKSPEDKKEPLVVDVDGIKVGIVNVTYGLNGFENHIDKEILDYMVCFLDEDGVKEQIDLCKKHGAELIIVAPHMGDEYRTKARSGIRKYGEAYIKLGADIVFAHHPHVVNPVENVEVELENGTKRKGLVFWSLGNFVSAQQGVEKEAGVIAYVHIRRDNNTGEIEVTSAEYLPTWTYKGRNYGNYFYILPVGQSIDAPETIKDVKSTKSVQNRLNSVWDFTTKIMGDEVAKPLREMPKQ